MLNCSINAHKTVGQKQKNKTPGLSEKELMKKTEQASFSNFSALDRFANTFKKKQNSIWASFKTNSYLKDH